VVDLGWLSVHIDPGCIGVDNRIMHLFMEVWYIHWFHGFRRMFEQSLVMVVIVQF